MRKSSPKEFWKLFKKKKPKETNDVSLEQFHKYFLTYTRMIQMLMLSVFVNKIFLKFVHMKN